MNDISRTPLSQPAAHDAPSIEMIDALRQAAVSECNLELASRLQQMRLGCAAEIMHDAQAQVWPPAIDRTAPSGGIPVVHKHELSAQTLQQHIFSQGSVHVPHFLELSDCAQMIADMKQAFAAQHESYEGTLSPENPWYKPCSAYAVEGEEYFRSWAYKTGALLSADSPLLLYRQLELLLREGVRELVQGYFGEQPLVSVGKTTARLVPLTGDSAWHQDGSFLGENVRALNIWIALNDCGEDSPGLDVVGQRLDDYLRTGTDEKYPLGVGQDVVEEERLTVVSPLFKAGDALIFDEKMLHRTGRTPRVSKPRYALETWLFPPTAYPDKFGMMAL